MPREPRHIHVRKGEKAAKFWLDPGVSLENSFDMASSELKELKFVIEEHLEMMRRKWDEYFPR